MGYEVPLALIPALTGISDAIRYLLDGNDDNQSLAIIVARLNNNCRDLPDSDPVKRAALNLVTFLHKYRHKVKVASYIQELQDKAKAVLDIIP